MSSPLARVFRSPSTSGVSAQELVKIEKCVIKSGLLRKKGKTLNIGKWPHRFVVLTHGSVYVYTNETSKSPNSTFSLEGYNRVSRCKVKGQDWCFSIMPAEVTGKEKSKTFASCSDSDRKTWIQAIKSQIYVANNIPKPVQTVIDKLKSMTIGMKDDEDEYIDLENPVYETNKETAEVIKSDDEDDLEEDSDSLSDSDGEEVVPVYKKTKRSMSLPHTSLPMFDNRSSIKSLKSRLSSNDPKEETDLTVYETCDELFDEVHSDNETWELRKYPSDHTPHPPLDSSGYSFDDASRPPSEIAPRPPSELTASQPPRYSELLREEEADFEKPDYVNLRDLHLNSTDIPPLPQRPSLENMCTVLEYESRDQLNALLHEKQDGTYLIRKSRTESYKVLVFFHSGHIREYKIFKEDCQVAINCDMWFPTIEELLQYYTNVEYLPFSTHFLNRGFHQAI